MMKSRLVFALLAVSFLGVGKSGRADDGTNPSPGWIATYEVEEDLSQYASVVRQFTLSVGTGAAEGSALVSLRAVKNDHTHFQVWLEGTEYPSSDMGRSGETVKRYLIQIGSARPIDYRNAATDRAVLPALGAWPHLLPEMLPGGCREGFSEGAMFLGHRYQLKRLKAGGMTPAWPENSRVIALRPDVFIGFPHNTKQKNEARRFDRSDYELIPLERKHYDEMLAAGITVVNVNAEQVDWVRERDVFYWGIGGKDLRYPECLYRSNYLGPALFLDEPAVVTRDRIVRPRLRSDAMFRKAITPEAVLKDFRHHFAEAKYQGAPTRLLSGLSARSDVNLGNMSFLQKNIYTWETMVSSAIDQLSEGNNRPPSAMVFEPPGRFGTRRTLPEMNMTYGCQIPVDNPKNLSGIIYGFLRGAARMTDKAWGMSIYGAVDRSDTFWFQTHAYDLGATHFYFWDTYQLACVPYRECLALARNLWAHAESHPKRDLDRLRRAAEVAVLIPPGYNLGHVAMGKGSLWGVNELNLERRNRAGVKYRDVMRHFFTEVERLIRLGVSYDLFWDRDGLNFSGYREVIHIREDGQVTIESNGLRRTIQGPRTPVRPGGKAPDLNLVVHDPILHQAGNVTVIANIVEGSAPIYYTLGTDDEGRYNNVWVGWELYGPEDEDYRYLRTEGDRPVIRRSGDRTDVTIRFRIEEPGRYRLRAATVDLSGRTAVQWRSIDVRE